MNKELPYGIEKLLAFAGKEVSTPVRSERAPPHLYLTRRDCIVVGNFLKELLEKSDQEPVVKVHRIHNDGENSPTFMTGEILSKEVNCWDLPIKPNDLLYTSTPPKREFIDLDQVDKHLQICDLSEDYRDGYSDGIIFAEREHKIRGKYE